MDIMLTIIMRNWHGILFIILCRRIPVDSMNLIQEL